MGSGRSACKTVPVAAAAVSAVRANFAVTGAATKTTYPCCWSGHRPSQQLVTAQNGGLELGERQFVRGGGQGWVALETMNREGAQAALDLSATPRLPLQRCHQVRSLRQQHVFVEALEEGTSPR